MTGAGRHHAWFESVRLRLGLQRHFVDSEAEPPLYPLDFLAQGRGGWSILRVMGHRPFDGSGYVVGNAGLAQVWRRLAGDAQELRHQLLTAAAFERGVAGQRGEQGGAQSVDVGGPAGRITGEDFRSGERRRTGEGAGGSLESACDVGDSEVAQCPFAVVGEQDIGRLDVAVQDSVLMRGLQRGGHLHPESHDLVQRKGTVLSDPHVQ